MDEARVDDRRATSLPACWIALLSLLVAACSGAALAPGTPDVIGALTLVSPSLGAATPSLASPADTPTPTATPPGASPIAPASSPPGPDPQASFDLAVLLPTPSTVDIALLVGSPASPSQDERRWLDDLQADLGRVDLVAYRDATLERLLGYLVVVVVARDDGLDIDALAGAWRAGVTVHLAGDAAQYRKQLVEARR